MSFDGLKKRFKDAKSLKTLWNTTYGDAAAMSMPDRDDFYRERLPGQKRTNAHKIFDSTAINATDKFVSNLQSSLVPPMKRWAGLVPGNAIDADKNLIEALQGITETMFSEIRRSNFDTQVAEAFNDLALGTGAMLVQRGKDTPLHFTTVPITELYIDRGPAGSVGNIYRLHEVEARNIQDTWEDAEIPSKISEMSDQNKPVKLVELVRRDTITVPSSQDITRDEEVDGFVYEVYTHCFTHRLLRREERSSPWVIFRWSVLPSEVWGRGPLLRALPDIQTINKVKELVLKNASLAVGGAYTVADDGTVNIDNIRIEPGSLIPVAANEGSPSGPTIAALPRTGDFNVSDLIIRDLQRTINEMMFADPLGPIDLPVKTATEVSIRQQELSKRIGSAFGRLQNEFLQPLIKRILNLLDDQGIVDLGDFKVDGQMIDINYQSPLALSQDEEDMMKNIERVQVFQSIFGQEGLMMTVDAEKFANMLFKDKGADLLHDDETRQQMVELLATLAQAQLGGGQDEQQPEQQQEQGQPV